MPPPCISRLPPSTSERMASCRSTSSAAALALRRLGITYLRLAPNARAAHNSHCPSQRCHTAMSARAHGTALKTRPHLRLTPKSTSPAPCMSGLPPSTSERMASCRFASSSAARRSASAARSARMRSSSALRSASSSESSSSSCHITHVATMRQGARLRQGSSCCVCQVSHKAAAFKGELPLPLAAPTPLLQANLSRRMHTCNTVSAGVGTRKLHMAQQPHCHD
jgi:hypothetical protein